MQNRILKFRAWIKKNVLLGGRFESYLSDEFTFNNFDGNYFIPDGCDLEDLEIMQYTGLKDKNGKEIYEGDILKTDWQHDGAINRDYKLKGTVYFGVEELSYRLDFGEGSCPLSTYEREELDEETIEVIGNIYENPELLTL